MIGYGAAYYPELWPEERWAIDAKLMSEAHYNVVRIGEFAWGSMERSEGCFNWGWLDRVIDLLYDHGISTILCTPTATPPPWVVDLCPEMLPMDANRSVRRLGGRRHYCFNNDDYRRHSARIAGALAERYGSHPAVIGWQIDNEFGQENTGRCYCPVCAERFRDWLRGRYASLEHLNDVWGTANWSSEFNDWRQIEPPTQGVASESPALQPTFRQNTAYLLDFERFSSDSIVAYQNLQVDAIRPHTSMPITHNTTGVGTDKVDIYDLVETLDVSGLDCYPDLLSEDSCWSSFAYSHSRGTKGKPFWILETQCCGGQNVWSGQATPQPPPGVIRLLNWQSFAHGAEKVLHFQWRPFAKGTEQLQHGVLRMDGEPGRTYPEIQQTALEIRRLADALEGTKVCSETAMLFSYDMLWAYRIRPVNTGFGYTNAAMGLYREITAMGIGVDVIPYDADLSTYRVVVVPMPILMRPDIAERLKDFTAQGGSVFVTFLAGMKDWSSGGFADRPMPGYLDELCGAIVAESDVPDARVPTKIIIDVDGYKAESAHYVWSDILEPRGAEVIGRLTGSYRDGEPVITRNRFGEGVAYYLGTWPEGGCLREVLRRFLDGAGVSHPPFGIPDGVEFVRRAGDESGRVGDGATGRDDEVYFLLNWLKTPQRVSFSGRYYDLMTERLCDSEIELPPYGVAVLRKPD
ncbi:MAG: beta-galactosidase [Armatimonadota bacterium]